MVYIIAESDFYFRVLGAAGERFFLSYFIKTLLVLEEW
jgi:hypothetical protein